jgi:hypothetical protein
MMTRFAGVLLLAFLLLPGYGNAQAKSDTIPGYINFDSLSIDDKALLEKYKDVFENDLQDFLDIFNNTPHKSRIDTSCYDMDRSSHVEVGLDFLSSNLINGRTTGITGVAFNPSVTYYHKTGLNFGVSAGFFTDHSIVKATAIPVVSLAAGYQHTFFRRWLIGAIYNHNFVTYGGTVSRRLLDNTLGFSTSIDIWKHIIINATAEIYWSSIHSRLLPEAEKFSSEIVLGIRKEFFIYKFIGAKVFTIAPALNFYFGDDNRAFAKQLGTSDVKGDSITRKAVTKIITNNYFGFLDIEPSVMIDWRIRNLDICVTPTLAIPFNTLNTKTDVRTLDPKVYRFYVQAGVKYLFCVKLKKKASKDVSQVNRPVFDP